MSTPNDDLDAVRAVTTALKDFDAADQERIIRWAREKLGLANTISPAATTAHSVPATEGLQNPTTHTHHQKVTTNIKEFFETKKPTSDIYFAATVAYFYKFEASESERKDFIVVEDLQDACRKVGRSRFTNPAQTLRNAVARGLLDRGKNNTDFTVNSIGENLVAMTLPLEGKIKARTAIPSKRVRRQKTKGSEKTASKISTKSSKKAKK